MNAVEVSLRSRQMPPLHAHPDDEHLQVLEGRLTVWAGEREVVLEAGESWVAPAGLAHTYRADSRLVRLVATTPVRAAGLYEDFLRAVAEPGGLTSEDEAALAVLSAPIGIQVLGAPGALPA
jgi:quercetin dioxygenase-like cupin family protein